MDWSKNELIFLYEPSNSTDNLILKRIDEISELISKKVKFIKLDSWKELES